MYKTFLMPRKIFATLTSSQCKVNGRAETRRLHIFNRSRNQEVKPEAGYYYYHFLIIFGICAIDCLQNINAWQFFFFFFFSVAALFASGV